MKITHRKAGELTDNERATKIRENKILKEGDYADISKNNSDDIVKNDSPIDMVKEINTEELATA